MASERMQAVMLRRQALLAKISGQRGQMAELSRHWQTPLYYADQVLVAARYARSHPLLLAGIAGLVVVKRCGVSALVTGGWRVWKVYRYLSAFSGKLMRGR